MRKLSLFKHSAVGLNITDRAMEVIRISKEGDSFKVTSKNKLNFGKGLVERGKVIQVDQLKEKIKILLKTAKPHPITESTIVFGLADEQVFTHLFRQPVDTPLDEKITNREAHHTFPIPPRDINVSTKKMAIINKQQEYLLTGVSKKTILEWTSLFEQLELNVHIHPKSYAIYRGLLQKAAAQAIAIINFDIASTAIHIFSEHGLHYSYVINSGGEDVVNTLSETLSVNHKKAEKMIHDQGVSDRRSKIFLAIANTLEQTFASIRDSINFYEQKYEESVSKIILTGSFGNVKGINKYAERFLELPTEIGFAKGIDEPAALSYIEALGLAHIGLFPDEGIISKPLHVPEKNKEDTSKQEASTTSETEPASQPTVNKNLIIMLILAILFVGAAFAYRFLPDGLLGGSLP